VNASFEGMVPRSHPYIRTLLDHPTQLRAHGNTLRVVIERRDVRGGDIFERDFLMTVREVNDILYLMPGVDRAAMRGLWTPNLRWGEVTEQGYAGGPVMPDRFDGSPAALQALKANVARAAVMGRYIGDDARSTLILVPLLDRIQQTGEPLDYGAFSRELEARVRTFERDDVAIRFVGFAKVAGDLIAGLGQVALGFAASVVIAALLVFAATRCLRSTLLLIGCALLAVVWLLGAMQWLGYALDPYTVLVPFLIFAIGLSHGAQKMNGILQDVGRGTHPLIAARYTFRRLFVPGLTALLANVVGFALLAWIDIPVLRDLALTASLGLALLIVTKLILVPVGLSVIGVSPRAARRAARRRAGRGAPVWRWLQRLTGRRAAIVTVCCAALLAGGAFLLRERLQIGDLEPGAPELRADARYNRDAAYLAAHYALSNDPFVIVVQTAPGACASFETMVETDRLGALLRELPEVRGTTSAADAARLSIAGQFEGNPKWLSLSRNPSLLGAAIGQIQSDDAELIDPGCGSLTLVAHLVDHRAGTLTRVVAASEAFAATHDAPPERRFRLAAGSAGIEAATNSVVASSIVWLHLALYAAVALICYATFHNLRAVVVALLPLAMTSLLCEALMVVLGIGVKIATLPVIAVGVGVGVDYALYLLSIQLAEQRRGIALAQACGRALRFTGAIVALIGLTLAVGVFSWVFSPIRFQADMGVLLGFMLLWNVVGALVLIPALSRLLLHRVARREPLALSLSKGRPKSSDSG
ncbi:MAG: MMPL family transporter, partial [Burkholderiaceae bacterium]